MDLVGGLQFNEPDALDPTVMNLLHRNEPKSFVKVALKTEGGLRHSRSLRTGSLSPDLLELCKEADLRCDSYYTVNSFYRPTRQKKHARSITACFSDFDSNRFDPVEVVSTLLREAVEGRAPMPSIFKLSGRGAWAIWIVHDPKNPSLPQPAFPDKMALYSRVQGAILRRFQMMGADSNATDFCRLTRMEGSVNTRTNKVVSYAVVYDANGQVRSYTLQDLANWFRVRYDEKSRKHWSKGGDPAAVARGKAGHRALWRNRLEDLDTLRKHRSGFRKGHRFFGCSLTSEALRHLKVSDADREAIVRQIAAECLDEDGTPAPLEEKRIKAALDWRHRVIRNDDIAGKLKILIPEAKRLKKLPPSPEWCTEVLKPTRQEMLSRRLHVLSSVGRALTVSEAMRVLEDAGMPCSRGTVWNTLQRLSPRKPT